MPRGAYPFLRNGYKKVLKDDGTIWISGTMHNIYSIGMALEEEGFKIINNITFIFITDCNIYFWN